MYKQEQSTKDRFISHINIPDNLNSCWEWIGSKHNGYGQFKISHKMYIAHRVSFELFVGSIPKGLLVCHSCDNRSCVNPAHLFLGTHQDNSNDMKNKNRQSHTIQNGENNGRHKLTAQEVYQIREKLIQGHTLQEIADLFGVSVSAIFDIKIKRNWKWL